MISKIFNSQSIANKIISVIYSSIFAQVLWYIFLPIITRNTTPATFGQYNLFLSISGFIAIIIGARADLAILCSNENELEIAKSAHLKVALYLLAPISIGLFFTNVFLDWPFGSSLVLLASLLSAFFTSVYVMDNSKMIKENNFKKMRTTAIVKSFLQVLIQVVGSFYISSALIIGKIFGDLCGFFLRNRVFKITNWKVSTEEIYFLKKNQLKYMFSLPQNIINALSQFLPIFIITAYFDKMTVGYYSLAFMLAVVPVGLIGSPTRQVLISKFSSQKSIGVSKKTASQYSALIFILGLLAYSIIYFVGDSLISFIYGSEWVKSFEYLLLLAIWSLFGLSSIPFVAVLLANHGDKDFLVYEIIQFIVRFTGLFLGIFLFKEAIDVIAIFVTLTAATIIIFIAYVLFFFKGRTFNES